MGSKGGMSDTDDFDAFYNATSSRLLHQVYAMTGNLADAEECVQETYARAWQHWKQVQHAENAAHRSGGPRCPLTSTTCSMSSRASALTPDTLPFLAPPQPAAAPVSGPATRPSLASWASS
jgi:hypothetical protein